MRRKRGHGGGDDGDFTLLGALGLGIFSQLDFGAHPPEPYGLEIDASYEHTSSRIAVFFRGDTVLVSAVDLTAALSLPHGAVGLTQGVGADFSSTEDIAAVRKFVRERILLGYGEDWGTASEEVAAAMRLIEEGKAYEVDWAGLVWAVLKAAMVAGTQRRYAPYLLRLLEYQRPELFSWSDEDLPSGKRWKGRTLQPCQSTDEKLGISEEYGLEEHTEEDIGDLEEMPLFGDGREATLAAPMDCKGTFLEQEEIHGVGLRHAGIPSRSCSPSYAKLLYSDTEFGDRKGIARLDMNNQTFACNYYSIPQRLISGTKSQPASSLQRLIGIEDDDVADDGLGICGRSAVIRNGPFDISPYPVQQHGQIVLGFNKCLQQMSDRLLCMEKGFSGKEEDCMQLRAEVQCLKNMVMEKDRIIEDTKCDILKDLRANETKRYQFEKAREVMFGCIQQYQELVKKSSAEFRNYKSMMQRGKGVDSNLRVHAAMRHLHSNCLRIESSWDSASLKLDVKFKQMEKEMANIDYEVKRLKDSISIPDLNNGAGQDGEEQTFVCKSEDRARADEGDLVSSSEEKGRHLGELIANPAQIITTEGSMDVNRVLDRCSEDEACYGGASHGSS